MYLSREAVIEIIDKYPCVFAKIEFQGNFGIAFRVGETISKTWQSNDYIVFWENGEHTVLPDKMVMYHGCVDWVR